MLPCQPEREPTPIAVAVVQYGDRFLVAQRPPGTTLAGLWEFPGGKVHDGESPSAAAVRECHEETGLDVVVLGAYPSRLQTYDHGRVLLHFLACAPRVPDATPAAPWRWVERAELARLEFPAGNRGLLEQLVTANPSGSAAD